MWQDICLHRPNLKLPTFLCAALYSLNMLSFSAHSRHIPKFESIEQYNFDFHLVDL